jgi:hypothetical protein
MFAKQKGFPDMEKDVVGWNNAWEQQISRFSTFVYAVDAASILHLYPSGDQAIGIHRSTIRILCELQRNLSVLVYQRFTIDNLEEEWLKLDTSARQTHLLQGMVRACRRMADQDDERLHCDDITLPYLQKGNGH